MTSSISKVVLISGANTGIGQAVAKSLAKDHGYHVIIGSRSAEAGKEVAATIAADGLQASSVQLDLSSDDSIASAASWVESTFGKLDVLINNAGVLLDHVPRLEHNKDMTNRERFSRTFDTNVIGTACLTEALLPLLRKSEFPRLIFVSSRMGSLAEATNKSTAFYSTDYKTYDASKAAVNMLALQYARILEPEGGVVNAVCPGLVQTKLTAFHSYGSTTEQGAKRIVELAIAEKGSPTATFTDINGTIPW